MNLERHAADYKPNVWEQYTLAELGNWVHNLVKRATHRENKEKAAKDLYDAENYLGMMQEKISQAKKEILG